MKNEHNNIWQLKEQRRRRSENVTLKVNPRCFKLHRSFYSTSCNLSKLANFSGIELYRTVSKFRKRKRKSDRLSITFKVSVTRDDSKRRFLAQQSATALMRPCFEQLQHCSNIATLCCTKNWRCESSRVTDHLQQVKKELKPEPFWLRQGS